MTSGKKIQTSNVPLEETGCEGIQGKTCCCLWLVYVICQHFGWSMSGLFVTQSSSQGPQGDSKHFRPWTATVLLLLLTAQLERDWFLCFRWLVVTNARRKLAVCSSGPVSLAGGPFFVVKHCLHWLASSWISWISLFLVWHYFDQILLLACGILMPYTGAEMCSGPHAALADIS